MTESSFKVKIHLLLISGPPGVGKTQFTCNLYEHIKKTAKNSNSSSVFVPFKIHYDLILDKQLESELISKHEWKSGREAIKRLVHRLITYLSRYRSRSRDLNEICGGGEDEVISRNFLKSIRDDFNSLNSLDLTLVSDVDFFVLLDDIFYYESMRRVFYHMCLEQLEFSSFFSISLETKSLDVLRERNRARLDDSRVDEKVLENIFSKFEYPDASDLYSRVISIDSDRFDFDSILNDVLQTHERFIRMIEDTKQRDRVKEEDAIANSESLVHRCDLILRRLVSEKMKCCSGESGAKLAAKKQRLLAEIRDSESHLHRTLIDLNDPVLVENELRLRLFESENN